jgi:hypothetical protein
MDKPLEICAFAVTCTKERELSPVHRSRGRHMFKLSEIIQAQILLMLLTEDRVFCVKILGPNTRCRKVVFVKYRYYLRVLGSFCRVVRYCVIQFHVTVQFLADVSGELTALETPRTHDPTTWRYISEKLISQVVHILTTVL